MKTKTPPVLSGVVVLLLALAAGGAGCSRSENDADLQVAHEAFAEDVRTLDPASAYDSNSLTVVGSIYEQLFQYAYLADTYRLVPLLAADLPRYSPDRRTVTIRIKTGVNFQDDPSFEQSQGKGRELTAHDFVYALKRLALPSLQSPGWWILDGKIQGINVFRERLLKASKDELPRIFGEELEGLRAVDNHTLQLKLVRPYPQLLNVLAMPFTSPVPREAVQAYADSDGNLTDRAVGTGPFVLKDWSRDRRLVLDRNPGFHPDFYPTEGAAEFRKQGLLADAGKLLPFLDRVVIDIISEQQPRWQAFLRGEQDRITLPRDQYAHSISGRSTLLPPLADRGIRLNIETGTTFYYLSFNVKDPILSNKYLRQALSSAINREKYIEVFTSGTGRKMTHALPPGLADRQKEAKLRFDYDLKRAKALLKRAGYPEGKGLPALNFDLRGADSLSRQAGDFFIEQFAAIGVKLNVIPNTFAAFLEKAKQGGLQVSLSGWSLDYPDAENVYQLFYGPNRSPGPNESNYDSRSLNRLYEAMAALQPGRQRAALVARMEELLQEDVAWAYLYYFARYDLSQPWLQNYRANDLILNRFKYYRVSNETKRRFVPAN